MKLTRSLLLVALFPLGLVACATHTPAYVIPVVDDRATTYVLNANTYPVTIYLSQAGMRHRLGVVESGSAATFEVPPRLLDGRPEFRLVASALGPHASIVSETFMLQPGQAAAWRLRETTHARTAAISLVSVR